MPPEIGSHRNGGELADKIRYYLDHPRAAKSLRTRGRARALRDQTWVRRFERLFGVTGLRR